MIDGDDELPEVEDSTDVDDDDDHELHNRLQRSMKNSTLFADAEIKTSDPSLFFEIKHDK